MHNHQRLVSASLISAACAISLLAGCASKPVPREQLAVGKSSIDSAQTAGADELAPVELTRARDKLAQAQVALHDKKYVLARRLAEEADADAQVARSRANAERSQKAADEVTASLQTLRQQLDQPVDNALMPLPPAAGPASPEPQRVIPGVVPSR